MKRWLPGIIWWCVVRPVSPGLSAGRRRPIQLRDHNPDRNDGSRGIPWRRSLDEVLENYRLVVEEKTLVYDWDHYPSRSGYLQESLKPCCCTFRRTREIVDMVIPICGDHQICPPDRRADFSCGALTTCRPPYPAIRARASSPMLTALFVE